MIYWLCDAPKMLKQKSQSLTTQLHPTQWLHCYLAVKNILAFQQVQKVVLLKLFYGLPFFLFTEESVRVSKTLLA